MQAVFLADCILHRKKELGKRGRDNARAMERQVCRGDLHIHSNFSDGRGTVGEIKSYADAVYLDFVFVTDHRTIHQREVCRRYDRCWWGQEPAGDEHIGILGADDTFVPTKDSIADYARAVSGAPFAFVAHPCGWYPSTRYPPERRDQLDRIGDDFAMEIVNGAHQVFDAWDTTDANAVALWDRHLSLGKRVRAVGGSDAHMPQGVGCVWTAVFADQCRRRTVLRELAAGHCYVSDGPALDLSCGGARMGDAVERSEPLELQVEAFDVEGLHRVSLVSQGAQIHTWRCEGSPRVSETWAWRPDASARYVRLEVLSADCRRGFSNPLYLRD
jgi:hypothetical protein